MEVFMNTSSVRLMIAAPESSADLLYKTKFWAPDPFIFLEIDSETILIASDLELGRARETATVDVVEPQSEYRKALKKQGLERPRLSDIVHAYLSGKNLEKAKLEVPGSMAVSPVERLRELGHEIIISKGSFYPERRHKEPWEIDAIDTAERATERAIDQARRIIWDADVVDGVLVTDGEVLTSERVRRVIEIMLLNEGYKGSPPIVSCGAQAALPHEIGHGPLKSGETIIIDVFPRSMETYYHADQTRSVVHGSISNEIRRMHSAVSEAVEMTLEGIRPGVDGATLHKNIQEHFLKSGFETKTVDGKPQGFFHGTGHGVGLEVHESPRIGEVSQILEEGDVVTVEPGLYYPDIGGIRIEELVVVTADGCRNFATLDWALHG